MATKKKVKKKVKKEKKDIVVTFDSKRNMPGLDFRKAQYNLYDQSEIEEIEDAMNYHGILLHADQVIEDYKEVYSVDALEEKYHTIYEKELEALDRLKLIMDEDCIYFFVTKVISQNYDVHTVPDPEYIIDNALKFRMMKEKDPEYFIQILENMINLENYNAQREIEEIFGVTGYDLESILKDIIQDDIYSQNQISLSIIKKMYQCMVKILEDYHFRTPSTLYIDFVEMLTSKDLEAGNGALEKGLVLYPKYSLSLYNASLCGLGQESYKGNEEVKKQMKQIYTKVKELGYQTTSQKEVYKIIQENFGYLENE